MTTGVFAFDTDHAGTAETNLGSLITSLSGTLADLDGFVTVVKANWTGDEMELYTTIQDDWKKNAKTVQDILDGIHKAIGTVKTSTIDVRQNVRDSLKDA